MYEDDYQPFVPTTLLEEQDDESQGIFGHTFNNVSLKSGAILEVYETDDAANITKLGPEYDVLVVEQRQDGGQASTIYKNCLATDSFGSIADFLEFKRRVPENQKEYKDTLDSDKMNGAYVLLLCLDGQSEKGIILGGLRNPNRKETLTSSAGNHLEFEFNGVNFTIKDDGSMKLTYKSKSNNDGKYEDESAGGTFIEINSNGQVDINTGLEGSDETYIRMDKQNKDVGLKAGANIGLTAKSAIGLNADNNINLNTQADLIASATGRAAITAGSSINLKADSQIEIVSPMQQFKADSMFKVESNMVQIKGQIVQLGQGGPPAVTATTIFMGVGNLSAPVICQAIGPFSSSVFFS